MNPPPEFLTAITRARQYYREHPFAGDDKVRPHLEGLWQQIAADPAHRSAYADFLATTAMALAQKNSSRRIAFSLDLIDFCTRQEPWPLVGESLRAIHPHIPGPDTRLAVEAIIKSRFDPHWPGGEMEFLEPPFDRWGTAGPGPQTD